MVARALVILALATGSWAAAPFPKPDPERRFPELKVPSKLGDPWRAAKEDWAGARRRTREDAVWADWLRRSARRWGVGWRAIATGWSGCPAGRTTG